MCPMFMFESNPHLVQHDEIVLDDNKKSSRVKLAELKN